MGLADARHSYIARRQGFASGKRSRLHCTSPDAIRQAPLKRHPVLPCASSQHGPLRLVVCASRADDKEGFASDRNDVQWQLLKEKLQDSEKREARWAEEYKALVANLPGPAGGRRQPAAEATRLWWQLLPKAEVKTVALKVLAEGGDGVSAPAAEQAGEEGDVVQVPAAVLEEVLDEAAEVPAVAQAGEEGNQFEGCFVEAELLQLADGTTFPDTEGPDGKPLNKLLLRKCYHSIVDKCMELTGAKRRALVIGLPGAGKSYGTHELLRRLRLDGKTVVWQRKISAYVLLLCPDGTVWRGDLIEFTAELLSPDTWYICDGMEPVEAEVHATTVLITSPRMANINEFVKMNYEELWVGRWKWSELLAARQYIWHTVTVADLTDRVDIVGKLPRYALAQNRWQALRAVEGAIKKSDARLIRDAVDDITTAPPASNKLVHVVASDDCRFLAFDWASPYVADEVTAKLLRQDLDGMEAFVRDFKGVESAGQLRGKQFQSVGGAWISAGGDLSHRGLDDQMEEPLRLPRQVFLDVRELPEKLKPDHYYRFKKVAEPAVDAISVLKPKEDGAPMEVLLWQFTVRNSHPVAALALHKILKLLEEEHKVVIRGMYFAVPADVYDQWKSRQEQESDERLDIVSQATCTSAQQAAQSTTSTGKRLGRPPKVLVDQAVLVKAIQALGSIKQFVVKIPATGVSKRFQDMLNQQSEI